MPEPRVERRADGSLLVTDTGPARWGLAAAGVGLGAALLVAVVRSGVTLLAGVVTLPLAVIAVLVGLAAARHRDWLVFDRGARQIVIRRGLGGLLGSLRTVPFDTVEAVVLEERGGEIEVTLRLGEGRIGLAASRDRRYVEPLVAAVAESGGWAVVRQRATGLAG